jgi:hypothetical protein
VHGDWDDEGEQQHKPHKQDVELRTESVQGCNQKRRQEKQRKQNRRVMVQLCIKIESSDRNTTPTFRTQLEIDSVSD